MADVTHAPAGTLPDGTAVEAWTLVRGPVTAVVLTHGARLLTLRAPDRDGAVADVVAGPKDLPSLLAPTWPFAGGTVGRWANRLADAQVTLDGTLHRLAPSEGPHLLHGGPDGFSARTWAARDASTDDGPAVRLALHSPAGDQGFPGALDATVTYRLRDGGRLELTHTATTDATTVVSLTNHTYWHLGGGAGTAAPDGPGHVGEHLLEVPAQRYVAVDEQLLPAAVRPVAGTRFDLRAPRRLDAVLAAGDVDHCLLLDPGAERAAVLTHPPSGRRLTVTTDQPGLQVYLGGQLDPPHRALALEPEVPPDAPNRPDLDLGPDRGVLRPGQTYTHVTTFTLDTV